MCRAKVNEFEYQKNLAEGFRDAKKGKPKNKNTPAYIEGYNLFFLDRPKKSNNKNTNHRHRRRRRIH